ncbi:mannan endo-1,4-beta-mannosidase 5-like [Senna tora]|uniref:mannan endo-1,4-beta-mannosidase n=1 Tax=Senna tora TaxID=362788 RepID=A0A834X140_9FABA|nr:mannan endo-1,4-beta-mannosidase 5-like [Senna tora]
MMYIQALDFVVAEARKYGMKLIMTLGNNWSDYGGKHQYVEWAKAAGAKVTSDDDFYTHPMIIFYYKDYIKTVLTRMNSITKIAYKDDPTIMGWEIMNELRYSLDLNVWISDLASHVKAFDDKHLLGLGMEGFYGDTTGERVVDYNPKSLYYGTDFIWNYQISEIDFTSAHAFPDLWLEGESDEAKRTFMKDWLSIHWSDSEKVLKKPLILGAFGKSSKVTGYTEEVRDSYMNEVYLDIYNYAKSEGTIGGGLVWQIMGEGMESYYDGFQIVLSKNPSTANVIHNQSIRMNALRQPLAN